MNDNHWLFKRFRKEELSETKQFRFESTDEYLARGGKITVIPPGVTGEITDDRDTWIVWDTAEDRPAIERRYLTATAARSAVASSNLSGFGLIVIITPKVFKGFPLANSIRNRKDPIAPIDTARSDECLTGPLGGGRRKRKRLA